MNAGIDHQPRRSPHFIAEPAHVLLRRVVNPHLDAKPLRIEAPTLGESGEVGAVLAPRRHLQLLLGRDLHMVAWDRLVDGERRNFPQRALIELGCVDEIEAGDSSVRASALVARSRVARRGRRCHRANPVGEPRQPVEQARHLPVDRLGLNGRRFQQLLGRLYIPFRVAPHVGDHRFAAGKAGGLRDPFHFGANPRDFAEPELVNLLRSHVRSRVVTDKVRVILLALGQR